jgi:hypothetical protein
MSNIRNHGGARAGAGRKPKALIYSAQLAQAEERIISALPDIIDSLVMMAKRGDVSAARYLIDRVFGRVREQELPLADDTRLPFTEQDVQVLKAQKRINDENVRLLDFG